MALAPHSQTRAAMSMGAEATNQSHPQNETMTDDIQAFLEVLILSTPLLSSFSLYFSPMFQNFLPPLSRNTHHGDYS